jgi:predicted TIM-barrel fold metal-dependent hydrolase
MLAAILQQTCRAQSHRLQVPICPTYPIELTGQAQGPPRRSCRRPVWGGVQRRLPPQTYVGNRRNGVIGRAGEHLSCIYNDWLRDFCSHYPGRQIGLACLPYGSVDRAVEEVRRVAKMGLKGLELSCSWDMEPMWHPS